MTYLITGKVHRKKGKTFPFMKVVEGADQSQAEHELKRWLRATKMTLQTSNFRPLEAESPKQEVSAVKPERLSTELDESVWRHVSKQGWPGFQDAVKALINVCEKIQTSPLQADQMKASALCRRLEELPIAA